MSNEYKICTTDGEVIYTVAANGTNKDTPITMIGHGQPEYGVDQNTNFLHLLENFASTNAPQNAIIGQLWFKKLPGGGYELCVCKKSSTDKENNNSEWDKLSNIHIMENSPLSVATGEMWYDTKEHSLKIYDENMSDEWNVIGPIDAEHKKNFNTSMVLSSELDTTQQTHILKQDLFVADINNDSDEKGASGALSLVTLKVLAKEIFNDPLNSGTKSPKAAAWIYKFLVNAQKLNKDQYKIEMVGRENYELIGITDDTDWTIELYKSSNNFIVKFQDNDEETFKSRDSRIVVGMDVDIVRV